MLPKPWQVGQAPNGLLNENSRGCGSSYGNAAGAALEPLGEHVRTPARRRPPASCNRPRRAAALGVGGLDRIGDARPRIGRHLDAIDDHAQHRHRLHGRRIDLFERHRLSVDQQPAETLAPQVLDGHAPTVTRSLDNSVFAGLLAIFRRLVCADALDAPSAAPRRRSKPSSRRVPSGSASRLVGHDLRGFADHFLAALAGTSSGRRARRAGACSRGFR